VIKAVKIDYIKRKKFGVDFDPDRLYSNALYTTTLHLSVQSEEVGVACWRHYKYLLQSIESRILFFAHRVGPKELHSIDVEMYRPR
jgi:hypothetical protein